MGLTCEYVSKHSSIQIALIPQGLIPNCTDIVLQSSFIYFARLNINQKRNPTYILSQRHTLQHKYLKNKYNKIWVKNLREFSLTSCVLWPDSIIVRKLVVNLVFSIS